MHQILEVFCQAGVPDRFYALKGMLGMGKTALVKQLCHFILERATQRESIFPDGVIYLKLT